MVDKFILSEIQAKGEICWVLFALISYHKYVFLLGKGFELTNPFLVGKGLGLYKYRNIPSNLISIHNVVLRTLRVLVRGRICGSQA